MKCLTTDKALDELIHSMEKSRIDEDTWDQEDEQILYFLRELKASRTMLSSIQMKIEEFRYANDLTNDRMQDEKRLLITNT